VSKLGIYFNLESRVVTYIYRLVVHLFYFVVTFKRFLLG